MLYELWDKETGNVVAVFPTEHAAAIMLAESIAAYGSSYVSGLALLCEDAAQRRSAIAQDDGLERLAQQHALAR
jgi:hypothetical protein